MRHWCSYHILPSSVIYFWKDARQNGIYLFYTIKKKNTTGKVGFLFKNILTSFESRPFPRTPPTLTNTKKAIWYNLLSIQIKQSYWLLCVANVFCLVQENHATVKLDSSVASHRMKTYSESRIGLRNPQILKEMVEKRDRIFVIGAALWSEKLGSFLEYCRSWKSKLSKFAVVINTGGRSTRVFNERRVSDGVVGDS